MPKYIERKINPRSWMKNRKTEPAKETVSDANIEENYVEASGSFSKEEVKSKSRRRRLQIQKQEDKD